MLASFVDSPFTTKAEYEAFLHLPSDQQAAALEAAAKKVSTGSKTAMYEIRIYFRGTW